MLRFLYREMHYLGHRMVNGLRNHQSPPVIVLGYHRVTTLATDPQQLAVTPTHFREQLQVIRNYPVLRFDDDWSIAREPSLVITFDDGYADNFLEALPILEEYGLPATFFVTAGIVGLREEFWWDELERLILVPPLLPEVCTIKLYKHQPFSWPSHTLAQRKQLYLDIHRLIHQLRSPLECQEIIDQLRIWAGVMKDCRPSHRVLSHTELKSLSSHPLVSIGAHGMSHLPFSRLAPDEQEMELTFCRSLLQQYTGQQITSFSYPFGSKNDFLPETITFVKAAGFSKAAANFPGAWHQRTDSFRIPRHLVRNWAAAKFSYQLSRFWLI